MHNRSQGGYDSYSASYHRAFNTNRPGKMLDVDSVRLPPLRLNKGQLSTQMRVDFDRNSLYFTQETRHRVRGFEDMLLTDDSSQRHMGGDNIATDNQSSLLPPIRVQVQYLSQNYPADTTEPRRTLQQTKSIQPELDEADSLLPAVSQHVSNRMTLKSYSVLPPIGNKRTIPRREYSPMINTTVGDSKDLEEKTGVFDDKTHSGPNGNVGNNRHNKSAKSERRTARTRINSSALLTLSEVLQEKLQSLADDSFESSDEQAITLDDTTVNQDFPRESPDEANTRRTSTAAEPYSVDEDHESDSNLQHAKITKESENIAKDPETLSNNASNLGEQRDAFFAAGKEESSEPPRLPKDPSQMLQDIRKKFKVKLKIEEVEKMWDEEMLKWARGTRRRNAICEEIDPMYADLAVIVGHNLLLQHLEEICMF